MIASRREPLIPLLVAIGAFDLFIVVRPFIDEGWSYGAGARSDPYAYNWVVLLLFVPYAFAVIRYRRTRTGPPLRTLLIGAALASVPLVFAPPSQSHDVYQYIFYARMQIEHGANPYVVEPARFRADIGFRFIGWPHQVSVYGPVWSLAVAGAVLAVHDHIIASLFAIKSMVLGLEALAVWGLLRMRPGPGFASDRTMPVLVFALNPLVMSTLTLGGHADAALAAACVWAMVWDSRGRPLLAGVLLALAALVKAYAVLPLAVYAFVVWRRGRPRTTLAIVGVSAAIAFAAFLPYWDGLPTFRGLVQVSGLRSSGFGGTAEAWLQAAYRVAGAAHPAASAATAMRALMLLALGMTAALLARSPRTVIEPWRASAIIMIVFLLVTPWSLPWYAVGVVAVTAALSDSALRDAVLTFSATSLVQGDLMAGAVRLLARHAPPLAVYGWGRRSAREALPQGPTGRDAHPGDGEPGMTAGPPARGRTPLIASSIPGNDASSLREGPRGDREVTVKITLSVIKADTGGFVGHTEVHPRMMQLAADRAAGAVAEGLLLDAHVNRVGDDLALIMTHEHGRGSTDVHGFAWDVFRSTTEVAEELGMYGAGQDLLSDAFSGNLRGMGPGYAEIEFEERRSEPVIVFLADKTEPGAFNYPLVRIFADPFTTPGLVLDPKMHDGYAFEVLDLQADQAIWLETPAEYYDLVMLVGAPHRFVVRHVRPKSVAEAAAITSTQRLSLMAGRYVGKDDPVMIVRCQSGLPAVGEVLEPFSFPHLVGGWMRGSHLGPLMPTSFADATPSRFDGPPRIIALGFQVKGGKLHGPRDLFGDVAFDRARQIALEQADYLRRMGPFEPHRVGLDELEYTTMPELVKALQTRWEPSEPSDPVGRSAPSRPPTPG